MLLFTSEEVVFIKGLYKIPDLSLLGNLAKVVEAFDALKKWRRIDEIIRRIKSLEGLNIDVAGLLRIAELGSYTIPYAELREIKIKKASMGKGVRVIINTISNRKLKFNVGPEELYRNYSKDQIIEDILEKLKSIPKLKNILK